MSRTPEKLKVAIATSFPRDPSRPRGGVEAVSVNLVRALARLDDLDVHVVTTDRTVTTATEEAFDGATLHRLPWDGGTVLAHVVGPGRRRLQAFLTELGPEVVHAHDFYGAMVKGMAVPRVFTIHGFIHADTREARGRFFRLRSWLWKRVELAGWADQPHIVSISPYVRERLGGVATGVIHDIDNPIAEGFFDVPRGERKGTLFCAALVCPRKNTLGLVEALGRLVRDGVDARLRLAGQPIDEPYHRSVQARVAELGLPDRVDWLGSIPVAQVQQELAAASAFVLPSFEEGSPMGIEEAMAVGVPVVTSNRCGMPYMVRHGESGYLIDPHAPEDIAWRLGQLLRDDELRTSMGTVGRRIAEARFHPDCVARQTREVYREAVRGPVR
jgi:glycosyltransferase involved in cell wall biosynthesis